MGESFKINQSLVIPSTLAEAQSEAKGRNLFLIMALCFLLQGCSIGYVVHAAHGHLQLYKKRVPITKVLASYPLTAEQKSKLELIADIKKYVEKIGLKPTEHYQHYVPLDREAVVYVLSASRKDALESKQWWFPFVGNIPYLGFFDLELAKSYQEDLKEENLDTYLRGSAAYSTLGWFLEPILSPMLNRSEGELADLLIHELTHENIYVSGVADFNEGVATFIGGMGSLLFIKEKFGESSPQYQQTVASQQDDLIFSNFIEQCYRKLETLYHQPLESAEKMKRREEAFQQCQSEFKKIEPQFKTKSFQNFSHISLNNAVLLSFKRYFADLTLFERIYERQGKDLKKTVETFQQAAEADDPLEYLRKFASSS